MPRESYATQQSKIQKEIARLQKQAQALQAKQRTPILASIVSSMREYDITPEEIAEAYAKKTARSAGRKAEGANSQSVKRPVPPKYRHPETGETWTGRGKAPRWMASAEESGKKREDFLIAEPA